MCAESWALGSRGARDGRGRWKKRRNKYRDLGCWSRQLGVTRACTSRGPPSCCGTPPAALVSALQGQHRPQGQIRQSLPVGPNSAVCCPAKDRHQRGPLSRLLFTSTFAFQHPHDCQNRVVDGQLDGNQALLNPPLAQFFIFYFFLIHHQSAARPIETCQQPRFRASGCST